MSKIYEALEHAKRESRQIRPVPVEPPAINEVRELIPGPQVSAEEVATVVSYAPPQQGPDLEQEMLDLYLRVDSMLPEVVNRIIQFIGSKEGEGTTTMAREFARVCAMKMHKTVLLLDIDRRQPNLQLFGVKPECGLDRIIEGGSPMERALVQVENTSLYVTSLCEDGKFAPKVLDSPRIEDFWRELRARFDLVIFDCPPATESPDGYSLTPKVDGVVLVIEAERTKWPVVQSVKDKLINHGGNILGIVFNKRRYYIPNWLYKRI